MVETDDSRVFAPAAVDVVHDGADSDHAAGRREDGAARAASCETEVGHEHVLLDLAQNPGAEAFPLTERRADREDFLSVHDGRRRCACSQRSGTGRTDATTFGSTRRTATSCTESATRTCAATLTDGVICTSTDVAVPTPRWLVAINPFASTTNPDVRVVAVQSATTLGCHCARSVEGSSANGPVEVEAPGVAGEEHPPL